MGWVPYVTNTFSVEKPEVKRQLERLRRRREEIINTDIKEMSWMCMDWISLAQNMDILRNFCKSSNKFPGSIRGWIIP
jgi:hypothetical protein